MKRFTLLVSLLIILLAACASQPAAEPADGLKVSGGAAEKIYTAEMLKALGESQATFREVTYLGVPLTTLIADAGLDPASVKAVKAVAIDGFSVNYEPALFNRPDTLVAYAQVDGPLNADDTPFRMVLPAEEGRMNPRQLAEIVIIP
jgi:hypothetical protein